MAIVTFTDLYARTRSAVLKKKWPNTRVNNRDFVNLDWNSVINDLCSLPLMLGEEGPDYNYEAGLQQLRDSIQQTAQLQQKSIGQVILELNETARKQNRSISPFAFNVKRAAAMKVLFHLYFVRRRGAQGVWVYSPPVSNGNWAFYALNKNRALLATKLDANDEYYSQAQRDLLRDGSERALDWLSQAMGVCGLDTFANFNIREWFIGSDYNEDTPEKMRHYRGVVRRGLQSMANMLNQNTLIFSYHPDLGTIREANTLGFVYLWERLDVIYMSNAAHGRSCNSDLDNCALTIIHEVSHRALNTDDHSYGHEGLKPSPRRFTAKHAIKNADSWAYFVADCLSKLNDAHRTDALVHKR